MIFIHFFCSRFFFHTFLFLFIFPSPFFAFFFIRGVRVRDPAWCMRGCVRACVRPLLLLVCQGEGESCPGTRVGAPACLFASLYLSGGGGRGERGGANVSNVLYKFLRRCVLPPLLFPLPAKRKPVVASPSSSWDGDLSSSFSHFPLPPPPLARSLLFLPPLPSLSLLVDISSLMVTCQVSLCPSPPPTPPLLPSMLLPPIDSLAIIFAWVSSRLLRKKRKQRGLCPLGVVSSCSFSLSLSLSLFLSTFHGGLEWRKKKGWRCDAG